jgi:hypothetical protein
MFSVTDTFNTGKISSSVKLFRQKFSSDWLVVFVATKTSLRRSIPDVRHAGVVLRRHAMQKTAHLSCFLHGMPPAGIEPAITA